MSPSKYPKKSRTVAILLAVFVGVFGVHKFYLGDLKRGALYLVFCWTTVPWFLGFYDAYKYATTPEEFETGSIQGSDPSGVDSRSAGPSEATAPLDDAVMSVEGANGMVTLYEDRLELSREGIGMLHKMQHGFKGDKEIPYESITSVQLRKPSSVTRGYIQFGQSGFSESDDGLLDATSDENTVLFDKGSLSEFEELRTELRKLKNGDVEESTGTMDGAMEKLRNRYAEGEIDEEEYEQRKEILQQG
ncbi:NINE protein [Salinirubellus sp. GCM10025818]|uniref:NINE protein n=1 Tax=Salinirubellus TaxID=2162630 RepID=UPI0030CF3A31